MKLNCKLSVAFVFVVVLLSVSGCYRPAVRHLSSDASLIVLGKTTKKEVLGYLGTPDKRVISPDGGEVWHYYQVKKSMLRKTPYIGGKLGSEEYDVLHVVFANDIVRDCVYRLLSEEGFQKSGIGGGSEVQSVSP